ncbi:P-loop NTPase [Streptomyces formicae]
MEDRRRVAVVEAAGQGSGYLLAPRLVLTAQHVLGDHTQATVQTPGGTSANCQVVWARSDGPYDAALLLADEDVLPAVDPVRWGRAVTSDLADVTILGFTALAGRDGRVGSAVFRGSLDPLEAVERDRYVLALQGGSPPVGVPAASPWAGLSGGAVWCGDTVVGVAVEDLPGWPHSRLEAVPAYALLADDGFRELIHRHTGTAVHLEPAELAEGAEAAEPLVPRSAVTLLHPRAETVRFTGRRELLDAMVEWSTSGDGLSVALLTGPGGAGKTRMAREVGHRLAASRYAVVHLSRYSGPEQHRRIARATAPVFLVIDYAESHVDDLGALLKILSRRPPGRPFKVLLVARSVGQWWDVVRADCAPEASDVTEKEKVRRWAIPETESLEVDEDEAFRTAVEDLTRGALALGLAVTASPDESSAFYRRSPRGRPRTILDIHMAALAGVLAPYSSAQVRGAQETLLLHESAYWRRTSRRAPLDGLGDAALRNAVVAATLAGPVPRGRAHDILHRVPRIGEHPESVRWAVADWVGGLYPRPEPAEDGVRQQWGPLEPDPLGEYLVGTCVAAEPEVFLRLVGALHAEEAVNSLLVLSRAAARIETEALENVLLTAVRADPARLAPLLIAAGTRSAEPAILIAALDLILAEELLPPDQLRELSLRTPLMTRALASWSIRLADRLAQLVDEQAQDPEVERAASLHNLAMRLMSDHRYEQTLATVTSALGLLDTVPTGQPLLEGLLLHHRAAALGKLGRAHEAVRDGRKSIGLVETWQPEDPDDRLSVLAGALNNLAINLADTGDLGEALDTARASVDMRRDLAVRQPSTLPDLARSLNTFAQRCREADLHAEALEAAEESLRTRRAAADDHPDAYLPELASTLTTKAQVLTDLGDLTGAREAVAEAASIGRRLMRLEPTAYRRAEYVLTLHTLAQLCVEGQAPTEAVAAADEAVVLARELAATHGRGYLPLLGASFLVQTAALSAASCPAMGFRAANKSAQVFRTVFRGESPDVSGLLSALRNQGQYLSHMGRYEEAEQVAAEAVAALAGLPEGLREEYAKEHADALVAYARTLLALDRPRECREARDAALALYRRLDREAPGAHTRLIADVTRLGAPPD